MSKTFAELHNMYREVANRFSKIELQEWKAEGAMIELSKQVGELAKQVMIKEKYYALEDDEPNKHLLSSKHLYVLFRIMQKI